MAFKNTASLALFLSLNILFFALVSGCGTCPTPTPKPKPTPKPHPKPTPSPSHPTPSVPTPTPSVPTPTPSVPTPTPSVPTPKPTPSPSSQGKCPKDTLKLGVCANLLGNLLGVVLGSPPKSQCCSIIQGLADLEAAVCLCTAIKANILGINLNVPVSLSLLLTACGKNVPKDFQC